MNLDRFSAPVAGETRTEKPVAQCAVCGEDLYEGDEAFQIDDDYICTDGACLLTYFDPVRVTL